MKWSTEAKAGVMVAASFLGLSGVLVAKKYLDPESTIEALASETENKKEGGDSPGEPKTPEEKKSQPNEAGNIVLAKNQTVTPPPAKKEDPGKEAGVKTLPSPAGQMPFGDPKSLPLPGDPPGSIAMAKSDTGNAAALPGANKLPEKKDLPFPAFPDPSRPSPTPPPSTSLGEKNALPPGGNPLKETKSNPGDNKGGFPAFPPLEPPPGSTPNAGNPVKEFTLPGTAKKTGAEPAPNKDVAFPPLNGGATAASGLPSPLGAPGQGAGLGAANPPAPGLNLNATGVTASRSASSDKRASDPLASGSAPPFPRGGAGSFPPEPLPSPGAGLGANGSGDGRNPTGMALPQGNDLPAGGRLARDGSMPLPGSSPGLGGSTGNLANGSMARGDAPLFNPVIPPSRIQAATFSTLTGPAKRTEFVPIDDDPPLMRSAPAANSPARQGDPSPGVMPPGTASGFPTNNVPGAASPGGNRTPASGNPPPAMPLPGAFPNPANAPTGNGSGPVLRMPKEDGPLNGQITPTGLNSPAAKNGTASATAANPGSAAWNSNGPVLRIPKEEPAGGTLNPVNAPGMAPLPGGTASLPGAPAPFAAGNPMVDPRTMASRNPTVASGPPGLTSPLPNPIAPKVTSWSEKVYTTVQGDTWESIAEKEYKKKEYARMLQVYNDLHPRAEPLPKTGGLPARAEVYLPPLDELIRRGAGEVPLNAFPPSRP